MVTFPAKKWQSFNLKIELVECKNPLLLSKEPLTKTGAMVDIKQNHGVMISKKVNMQRTSTGKEWVNIMRNDKERWRRCAMDDNTCT